jgi:hypothetical protein
MDTKQFLEALYLFNEKSEKLEKLSFIPTANKGTSASLKWKEISESGGSLAGERVGPSFEAIEAYILTFRFFIQDNEICSLRNMAKFYDENCKNKILQNNFHQARNAINNFLDSGPAMGITFLNETLSYRRIMDIFIYGEMSHATKEKKELFKDWMNSPLAPFIENSLVSVLVVMFKYIVVIKGINSQVINELESTLA